MSNCNFCTLRTIKASAKKKHLKVTTQRGWHNGIDVFVHPRDIKILPTASVFDHMDVGDEDDPQRKRYFVAWLMEVPDKCMC
jgi:hypothetical protein